MLCQVHALSCLKNFSAQSDLVAFCVPDNKRHELEHGDIRQNARVVLTTVTCACTVLF